MRVILASSSPRRKELLRLIYNDFEIIPSTAPEICPEDTELEDIPFQLAKQKASDIFGKNPDALVIGADTIVLYNDMILGKPASVQNAGIMLRMLSGRIHKVITGVSMISRSKLISIRAETNVEFYELSDEEIDDYIRTGEPMDKAGAYGIQGIGSKFIKQIHGDYNNVVGLPVSAMYQVLKQQELL